MSQPANAPAQRSSSRKGPKGPIELVISIAVSLVGSVFVAVLFGTLLEVVGLYSFWKQEGTDHAHAHLVEDFAYVQAAGRSIPVADTRSFAVRVVTWARWPYEKVGIVAMVGRANAVRLGLVVPKQRPPALVRFLMLELARISEVLVYVTQDVAVRLALAFFALPALVLIMAVGVVDGLVQRDVRKWSGGRESSFVYHHAKHYAKWFVSVGFAIYLGWPFSGFNPVYLLYLFTALASLALALTFASFKKYL